MPYSDKHILTDKGGKPIPQVWNPVVGDYEPLPGSAASGMRSVLYDASGNPLVVDDGKLAVRATELEGLLNTLSAKEDALSNLVQQVSDRIGEVSPTPTANTVADRLRQIANTLSGTATENTLATVSTRVQQVIDLLGEISGTPTANTLADRLKQIADRLGEVASSPTANTVLARLKTLEGYLDGLESALGTQADAEATGNGSIIGILKRLRTILTDAWSDPDNALQVRSVRRYDVIKSAPVVGVKTVTSTAAEIFAGASRLSGRYAMAVYNEGSQPVYWGGSSVTTSNGFPLLPQDSIVFSFDPNVATAIYMIAASNTPVRVVELA